MSSKKIYFLFLLLGILSIPFGSGVEHATLVTNGVNANSIEYINGKVYIDPLGNQSINASTVDGSKLYYYDYQGFHRDDNLSGGGIIASTNITYYSGLEREDVIFVVGNITYYIKQLNGGATGLNVGTFPKFQLYYRFNNTNSWSEISTPYVNYNGDTSDSSNFFTGFSINGNNVTLGATYFVAATNSFMKVYNSTTGATITFTALANVTSQVGGLTSDVFRSVLTPKDNSQTYAYVGTYRIESNGSLTDINIPFVQSKDSWYSNTDSVMYIVSNSGQVYRSTSLTNFQSAMVNLSGYSSCNSLLLTNVSIEAIDCINATNCMLAGSYGFNGSTYSLIVRTDGTSCTDIYSNANDTDTLGTTIKTITNDGNNTYFFAGNNYFSYYGILPNSTTTNNTPICIDNYNLCTNPLYNSGGLYCDVLGTTYCSGGCTNDNSTGTVVATCTNDCTNDCNLLGYQISSSTTTFQICGNYDTDLCLEYSGNFSCQIGEISINGYCFQMNTTGLTNNTAFTVTPYQSSDDSTTYSNDASTKTLSVATRNVIHIQGFSINSAYNGTYSSRTCDYQEVNKLNMITSTYVNTSYEASFTALSTSSFSSVYFTPYDNISTTVRFKDSIGNTINGLVFNRSLVNKSVCVYYINGTQIGCDYSYNYYDDLIGVNLTQYTDFESGTYVYYMIFDRVQDGRMGTYPLATANIDYAYVNISSTNATINSIIVNTYSQPSGFSTTLRNNYDYLPCSYGSNGCRSVRTYNNNNGLPDFTNYYDYRICVNAIASNDIEQTSNSFFGSLSLGMKIVLALIISMILGVIAYVVLVAFELDFGGKFAPFTSLFIFIISTIGFSVMGWIPVWVIILSAILASSIVGVVVAKGTGAD